MSHLKQGKIQAYVEETSCQKPILEYENVTPNILIGADLMWDIFEPQPITELTSHLFLVPTKFGPILTGRATSQKSFLETSKGNNTPLQCSSLIKHEELNLDQYWNLESIGITDPPNQKDDDEALHQFYKSVSLVDGRYTVSWPWRNTPPKLPLRDNYQLSVGRLRSLIKRLSLSLLLPWFCHGETPPNNLVVWVSETIALDRKIDSPKSHSRANAQAQTDLRARAIEQGLSR
ncbi:unnamed protein product [Toxocara canis]|uniref:DUF1758 domain-containing protein n=1 Tax=Toxocara canis TaxID=6265 RepID=A0A183U6B6_TOXCA|nr:unnamed protein product [Toxocara canis]